MDKRLAAYLKSIGAEEDALDGWTISEAFRGGQSVGFVAVNGTEIHILPLAEKKAMSRRNILECLEPIFAEHGYATTRVPVFSLRMKWLREGDFCQLHNLYRPNGHAHREPPKRSLSGSAGTATGWRCGAAQC